MKRTIVWYQFFCSWWRAIAFYIMLRKFRTFLPKNAFLLKSTKAFMKTLIDDLRKEAEKMRKKLKQLGSQKRHTFIGRFERVGYLYYGTGACFLWSQLSSDWSVLCWSISNLADQPCYENWSKLWSCRAKKFDVASKKRWAALSSSALEDQGC